MAQAGDASENRTHDPSRAFYEAAFNALPDAAAVIDADGRIFAVNAAFATVFGDDAWIGRSLDRVFADRLDAHAAPWRRDRSHASPRRSSGAFSARLARQAEPPFAATLRVSALPGEAQLVVITHDEAAHLRLENAQARLTETFAAPRAGAFAMNLCTGEGHVSGFLGAIFSLDAGATTLTRSGWLGAMDPAGRAAIDEALAAARGALFAPVNFSVQVWDRARGELRWLRHDLSAVELDPHGQPVRLTGAVTDVTDLAAETRARQSTEAELALAVEFSGLTRWRYDPTTGAGRIEGPLAGMLGGPEFDSSRWSSRLAGEDARRLNAALCAAEYGGAVDLVVELRLEDARAEAAFKGRRGSDGVISGFASAGSGCKTDEPSGYEAREAAASARMSTWTYDIMAGRLRLTGPVLAALGLPGAEHVMDILDWRGRVPEDDRGQMDIATQSLRTTGVTEVEYRVQAQNGRLVWLSLRGGVSEQSADGTPLRYSGFISEIGERKRLERRLAEREQQLADAVDAGLIGIWTYDFTTATQTARGRILDWMGKPRDTPSVDGADWLRVIHPDDQDALRTAFAGMASGAPVKHLDVRLKTSQGWRWARTHGAPVTPADGAAPRRAAGVIVDIHAEHVYADALASEKERFKDVYRQTPALLHTIDADGRTLAVSDYWLKRLGYDRDAVIGAPSWFFMDSESAARIQRDVLPRTLAEGRVENEPVVVFTATGEQLDLRLSAFLEVDAEGAPLAAHGVLSDVTDLRAAQRDLEAHAGALERTNRELDRFTTMASHDLQEPLRKISAFASLLSRRLGDEVDADSAQALDFLVDAAGRMRTLIDDLLAYSRASNRTLELRQTPLYALVHRVLSGLDMQIAEAEADVTLEVLPEVTGDEVLLGLLFQNLIANALKYRKANGVKIIISAVRRPDDTHAITIADDGIGFDPVFAEKIFEPFARLHGREAFSGTGIGLAICQQAAERLNGRIEVQSTPDVGSAFTVILPASDTLTGDAAA